MIKENETVEKQTNPYAKQLFVAGPILAILFILGFYIPYLRAFRIPLVFLLPIFCIYCIGLAVIMVRKAVLPLLRFPLIIGLLVTVGGLAFQGFVAVIKESGVREINLISRSLLDSGYSENLITIYSVITEIAFVVLICVLWAAFLKHKETIIALAKKNNNEKSRLGFFKAAMGGAHLSWRQFILPLKMNELPKSYYLVWILAFYLFWTSLSLWYPGLHRLGLVSLPPYLVLIIMIVAPFISYLLWLWLEYKNS